MAAYRRSAPGLLMEYAAGRNEGARARASFIPLMLGRNRRGAARRGGVRDMLVERQSASFLMPSFHHHQMTHAYNMRGNDCAQQVRCAG